MENPEHAKHNGTQVAPYSKTMNENALEFRIALKFPSMKLCDIAHGNAESTQTKRHMQADLLKASALRVFFSGTLLP